MPEAERPVKACRGELSALAEIGRAILEAQLDQDQLCELICRLAGQIVPTDNFQLGLIEGNRYQIKVWVRVGQRQPAATFIVPEGQGVIAWLRTRRQPLLVHDFKAEADTLAFRPTYQSEEPPRSAIFLPLLVGDDTIGAMSIQSFTANAFTENDVRLLSVLANQAASALNNARLYERGQRRLRALTAVAEVGRKINSILDLNQLLAQVVELIQAHFGYYHVQIFLVPRGSSRAYFQASSGHGLNEKWRDEGRSLRIGLEGIIGWVAQHRKPLLVNDVSAEPRYIADDPRLLPATRAELAVPLLVENEVVGVLDVQSTEAGSLGDDDSFVVSTLADQVAVAVNSARAYEAQREEAWVTTVMLQVAEATSQAADIDAVLDAAVRVINMLAGVDSSTIWLWDDERGCFQYGASFGLAWERLADGPGAHQQPGAPTTLPSHTATPIPPHSHTSTPTPSDTLRFLAGDWPALDHLREARSPAVIDLENIFLPAALQALCPGDTLALLPMLNKGQVFGVMGVSLTREAAPEPNERRLAMLSGIAHQVASAVDNARLAAAREEEAWVSTVLLQVAEAMGRFQPLAVTLAQLAHITPLLAGVDRCAVLLRDEDGDFAVREVYAVLPEMAAVYQGAVIRPGELPLLDDARRLGQALVVEDAVSSPRVPQAWRERFASRTILVVPILVADEVIGALLADDVAASYAGTVSPRRIRILNGIAGQAAVAIENARLQAQETAGIRLVHELELGHDIQRSLLPQAAPQVPGYQVVYRWRSAREVGGDFFDFMTLPSGDLGIVVADVADKGIPAALYMMFARTVLRSNAFSGREPAAMLERSNELIVKDSAADMFVTAYYSVLDPRDHTLTYASAGHNLAFIKPAGGIPQPMTTEGIALGVVTPVNIEQKVVKLAPGDAVLFYTDGVTDALDPEGQAFGDERLGALLLAHGDGSAEAIADAIDSELREFGGAQRPNTTT